MEPALRRQVLIADRSGPARGNRTARTLHRAPGLRSGDGHRSLSWVRGGSAWPVMRLEPPLNSARAVTHRACRRPAFLAGREHRVFPRTIALVMG